MNFVRELDKTCPSPPAVIRRSRIFDWRNAWTLCFNVTEHFDPNDITQFHKIFELWMPLLNQAFESPIKLERYDFMFFYCDEQPGPKEVIHLYCDETLNSEGKRCVYIILDTFKFRQMHKTYCDEFSRNKRLLVDEARGTVQMLGMCHDDYTSPPPSYFKNLATWLALFAFTCHALAHLDTFDKENSAHYDTHSKVRESLFFNLVVYGVIGRVIQIKY